MPYVITTYTKGSSNKPKTILKSGGKKHVDPGVCIQSGKLIIDRLSVTIEMPKCEICLEDLVIHEHHLATEFFKVTKPSKGYRKACRIVISTVDNPTKWPFYEFRYGAQGVTHARLDFIPADLGEEGMSELHEALWKLLPFGWHYIFQRAKISRIDVAADFPDLGMSDFYLLPKQSVSTQLFFGKGKLQTIVLGKPKGSHTAVYDRLAKRKAKGTTGPGKHGVRVERRLKQPNVMLRDIQSLTCPFGGLEAVLRHIPKPSSEKKDYIWEMFKDTCAQRSLVQALSLLPVTKRTLYRKHIKASGEKLWDLNQVWSQWPDAYSILMPSNIEVIA